MRICSAQTENAGIDLYKLVMRRMERVSSCHTPELYAGKNTVSARLCGEADTILWCETLSELLTYDFAHFEIARMIDAVPVSHTQKQHALVTAVKLAHSVSVSMRTEQELREYYLSNARLVLDGFLRFRMKDTVQMWEQCAMRALEETLIQSEYLELMSLLSAFVHAQSPRVSEVNVILNADGSCTLSDDMTARIEYEGYTSDGVVSMLVGLAPEHITVYDLSMGKSEMLTELLLRVFRDRVRIFR